MALLLSSSVSCQCRLLWSLGCPYSELVAMLFSFQECLCHLICHRGVKVIRYRALAERVTGTASVFPNEQR